MALRRWRRAHGPEIRAHVDPGDDARWMVSIWRGETCVREKRRRFSLLTDAQSTADALVCDELGHQCDAACGPWLPQSK